MDEREPQSPVRTEPGFGTQDDTATPPADLHIEGDFRPSWLDDHPEQSMLSGVWAKRLMAFAAAGSAVALVVAGGMWLNSEQKSHKAMEVLAQSSRAADQPKPVTAPAAPAAHEPAPAPVVNDVPPLVTLPPEEVKPVVRAPVKQPLAVKKVVAGKKAAVAKKVVVAKKASPAKKPVLAKLARSTPKKAVARVAAKPVARVPLRKAAARPVARKVGAAAPKRPPAKKCLPGELARNCRR